MKKTLSVYLALLMLLCRAYHRLCCSAQKTNGVLRQRRCSCLYR